MCDFGQIDDASLGEVFVAATSRLNSRIGLRIVGFICLFGLYAIFDGM
jgi:hypothetical protein